MMNFFGKNKKTTNTPTVTLPSLTVTPSRSSVRQPPQEAFASNNNNRTAGEVDTTQIDLTVPQEEQPPPTRGLDERFSIGDDDDGDSLDDVELAVGDGDDYLVVVDTNRLSNVMASRRQANNRRYILAALVMVVAVAAIVGIVVGVVGSSSSSSTIETGGANTVVAQDNEPISILDETDLITPPGELDPDESMKGVLGYSINEELAKLANMPPDDNNNNDQGDNGRQLSVIPRRFRKRSSTTKQKGLI